MPYCQIEGQVMKYKETETRTEDITSSRSSDPLLNDLQALPLLAILLLLDMQQPASTIVWHLYFRLPFDGIFHGG